MRQLTIKQIEEIKRLYEKLQVLDREIIVLQRVGQKLPEGEKSIRLTLNVKDLLKKKEHEIDPDTFEMISIGLPGWGRLLRTPEPAYQEETITEEINEVYALELVAFLLNIKEKQRTAILRKLEGYGIQI